MDELEKVWLACALDGEGHLSLLKVRKGCRCAIVISNTDIRFVEKAQQITAKGKIIIDTSKRKQDIKVRRLCYTWRVVKQSDCFEILTQILPYLIIKKEKADRILLFLKFRQQKGKRKWFSTIDETLIAGTQSEIEDIQKLF